MPTPAQILRMACSGAAAAFDPTSIGGLSAWYDASDTATITDAGSGAVSAWNDKSGNARHLAQATAARRPTTGTRTQNGLNVLDFGADDYVDRASFWYNLSSTTLFCVFKVDTDPTESVRGLVYETDSTQAGAPFPEHGLRFTSTQTNFANVSDGGSVRFNVNSTDPTNGVPHLARTTDSTIAATVTLDGASTGSAGYTRQGTTFDRFQIGRCGLNHAGGDRYHDGWIGEVLIYSSVLSGGNITLVENYLETKWGL